MRRGLNWLYFFHTIEFSSKKPNENIPKEPPVVDFKLDSKEIISFKEGIKLKSDQENISIFSYEKKLKFQNVKSEKIEIQCTAKENESSIILASGKIIINDVEIKSKNNYSIDFKLDTIDKTSQIIISGKVSLFYEEIIQLKKIEASYPPNVMFVTVCSATNLKCSERDGADAFVELKYGNFKEKTHHKDDNNNPIWNQRYVIDLDGSKAKNSMLSIEVLDKNIFKDESIGFCEVNLKDPKFEEDSALDYATFIELPLYPQNNKKKSLSGNIKLKLIPHFTDPKHIKNLKQGEDDFDMSEGIKTGLTPDSTSPSNTEEILNEPEVKEANLFFLTICSAKDLKCNEKSGADGFVEMKTMNWSAKTSKIDDTNNPTWSEKFAVPLNTSNPKLKLEVFDYNKIMDDSIGITEINLMDNEFFDIKLLGKAIYKEIPIFPGGSANKPESGHLKIKLVPTYAGRKINMNHYIQGEIDDSIFDDGVKGLINLEPESDFEDDETSEEAKKKEKEAIEKEKKEYEEAMKLASSISFKDGDYTALVHVIEVKDLKAEGITGANDPYVQVSCCNQKKNTSIKTSCLDAIFDDLFYIELPDMKKHDLETANVRLDVRNSNGLGAEGDLIGSFQIDFEYVYFLNEAHEFYRQWIPLVDMEDPDDSGIQGTMLVSVTIIGPGEKAPIHNRKKEIEEENNGNGKNKILCKLPSPVQQELHFLCLNLYRGTEIPPMDSTFGQKSIDAYVRIKFSDQIIKSKVVTVKAQSSSGGLLSVVWNQRIYIPVMVPTMSNRIEINLMDEELLTDDELVGTCISLDFKAVQLGLYKKPFWAFIYGPTYPDTKITYNQTSIKRQASVPEEATYYRGSLLLSISEDLNNRDKKLPQKVLKKAINLSREIMIPPPMQQYALRALIYSGSDIPSTKKVAIKVCIGTYYDITPKKAANNELPGVVSWVELLEIGKGPINLSANINLVPDIFVYLVREEENICYCRFSAKDILAKGFTMKPKWVHLLRDDGIGQIKSEVFPGSILMKLGMSIWDGTTSPWPIPIAPVYQPFTLFTHIYQARDLNSSDSNGMLDPFIKVRFNGKESKTQVKKVTRNPSFFETLRIETLLPPDPEYWPQVMIEVWDWDTPPDPADWVGTVRLQIEREKVFETDPIDTPSKMIPKWRQLQLGEHDETQGQILVDYEVVKKSSSRAKLPDRLSIVPEMIDYIVEVLPVGLRNLKPKGLSIVSKPYVEFQIGETQGNYKTRPSNMPSTVDPNFEPKPIHIPCKMPKNPMFALCLEISVFDRKLGGFSSCLLGTASIPLGRKIKKEGNKLYKPPGGVPFMGGNSSNPFLDEPVIYELEETENEAIESSKIKLKGALGLMKAASVMIDNLPTENNEEIETSKGLIGGFGSWVSDGVGSVTESVKKVGEGLAVSTTSSTERLIESQSYVKAEYLIGRERYHSSMERSLATTPFEEYPLYKGMKRPDNILSEPFYKVGTFKGVVRVFEEKKGVDSADPLPFDLKNLRPNDVEIRIYILKASNLPAKNVNNRSDPYLFLKLGDKVIDDRNNHLVDEGKEVGFYKCFKFPARLPGPSKLEITIKDWEYLGPVYDSLIGTTVIDLEDRFYHNDWRTGNLWKPLPDPFTRQLSKEDKKGEERIKIYGRNTPYENRQLWSPGSKNGQGSLKLWIDIFSKEEISKYPEFDITPPPPKPFELRVIIWKTRNWTMAGDIMTSMTDLFFKVKLGPENDWQNTDTHLRAETKMSFNWRMKFKINLPVNVDKEGLSLLTIQAYDYDLLYNDFLFSTSIDLAPLFAQGYTQNEAIHFFSPKYSDKAQSFPEAIRDFLLRMAKIRDEKERLERGEIIPSNNEDLEGANKDSAPLITDEENLNSNQNYGAVPRGKGKVKKKKQTLWQKLKNQVGLGSGPDNSGWISMQGGEVLLSIELLPGDIAEKIPAGLGRSEPNANPELPLPEGRLDPLKMLNPFYAIQACVGSGNDSF